MWHTIIPDLVGENGLEIELVFSEPVGKPFFLNLTYFTLKLLVTHLV